MESIREKLNIREKSLVEIIRKVNQSIGNAPSGKLRITTHKGKPKYYIRDNPSDHIGIYVNKANLPLARAIAQRDYDSLLKEIAERELKAIRELRQAWDAGTPEDAYSTLTPARRSLVKPRHITDEEYARQWLDAPYPPKGFKEGYPVYQSAKGQRVRSKSEALILDIYDSYGIPVKYECPLRLKSGRVLHPDVTALNVRQRKTYIHDHLGMMDDPRYMDHNVGRLNELMLNGWIPGVNMILTFETKDTPLDVKVLRTLIEAYLL